MFVTGMVVERWTEDDLKLKRNTMPVLVYVSMRRRLETSKTKANLYELRLDNMLQIVTHRIRTQPYWEHRDITFSVTELSVLWTAHTSNQEHSRQLMQKGYLQIKYLKPVERKSDRRKAELNSIAVNEQNSNQELLWTNIQSKGCRELLACGVVYILSKNELSSWLEAP